MSDRRAEITELSNVPQPPQDLPPGDETDTVLSNDRDPLDRVAEEFVERCRRGEAPSIAEYEARFPDQAAQVRKLLGAVATMEQLRRGSRQARFMPERIGEFRVLRELGRGGMGVVYEAVQESLWRHVAVKAIHHSQLDSKRLQRFQREAQAVAQLHHTNIVPIFGVGEHDGVPYYAMQYIKGRGLDAVLESWRRGDAPNAPDRWRTAARYAQQAAEALGYAHEQGVFHRDIKPANLLIDEQDAVWITDFGLAKIVGHEELTASGDVIGTLRYLAPESLRGISEGRSDVYSLGLTLYEMLTLSPPFGTLSPSELLHRVSDGQPTRPRSLDPTIPRDLETIVLKATARELKDRYPTARALASDLASFLSDRPIQARRFNLVERAWRWSRRNRGIAAFAALAVGTLLLAAVSGWASTVRIDLALKNQKLANDDLDQHVRMLNRLIMEMSETLFPEDSDKADDATARSVPLVRPQSFGEADPARPTTFADPADGGPAPPSGEAHGGFGGPGFGPGPRGNDFGPPGGFAGGPPPDGGFPGAGPPPGSGVDDRARTYALLKNVLAKYERIVQSQTDPEFLGEAAWLYYKMGTYCERLDKRQEADRAFDRSLLIFDQIAIGHPRSGRYFRKFFKISSAINPWQSDPAMQQAVLGRFQRIERILGRLLLAAPGNLDYLRARMQLLAKLGLIGHSLGRVDTAQQFDEALAIAGRLIDANPEEGYPHSDRSDVLEAYALVREDRGEDAEARQLLDAAMADLKWVAADELKSEPLASRMESVADDFERLGDAERSDRVQTEADRIDPRPPLADRPKPGRPFAPRRLDPGPAPGGDPPD